MLNKILALVGIHRTGMVVQIVSNLIKAFEQEYGRDHDSKVAALDTLIDLMKSHRDDLVAQKKAEAPVAPPIPPA
ncbi:MAG: hypothetical protein PHS86_01960 [Syntrophaceae bacterium]|nr:hypothetical protein [Syntrophaceae bacterium]